MAQSSVNFLRKTKIVVDSKDLSKETVVRAGNLWSILADKTLLYMDLNDPSSKTIVKNVEMQALRPCMFLYVSNSGNYCAVRVANDFYLISNQDFKPKRIDPTPSAEINSIYFYKDPKTETEYIFIIQALNDFVEIVYSSIPKFLENSVHSLPIH